MAVDTLPVLINGVEYTHADVTILFGTTPIIGVTAINYQDPQQITPNFANANKPMSVGFGKIEPQGNITLTLNAMEALQAQAASFGGRIQNLPFADITVAYFSTEGGIFISHRLKRVKFKGRNVDSAVDNTQIEETIELFIGDIQWQTV